MNKREVFCVRRATTRTHHFYIELSNRKGIAGLGLWRGSREEVEEDLVGRWVERDLREEVASVLNLRVVEIRNVDLCHRV